MKTKLKAVAVVGVMSVACLAMAARPVLSTIERVPGWGDVTYTITPAGLFASGCTGGGTPWDPCPMCPIVAAPEFAGSMTLTPRIHVPQGHHVYDVAIRNWQVTFYNHDEPTEITGTGVYDRWIELDGTRWQTMTLDLHIGDDVDGEDVYFFSDVVEDPAPSGGAYPDIQISLESDTECWGYWIIIEAQHEPAKLVPQAADSAVAGSDAKE